MWDWDAVYKLLTHKCDEQGGYYRLSNEDAARLKTGAIGDGWGQANLRNEIFPRYRARYSEFDFGIIEPDRKYIWCKRKQA